MAHPSSDQPRQLGQNIDSVLEVHKRESEHRSSPHRLLDRISREIGRPLYIIALCAFVAGWVSLNQLAPHLGLPAFDPLPFPLLAAILALAALVTTTIILVAQNLQARVEQQHMHIALQVNLLTEQKVAKIIALLEELRRDLPMVKDRYDPQAASLAKETDALQVLTAIEEGGLIDDPSQPQSKPAGTPDRDQSAA